jgi:hypothetical protein
MMSIRLWTVAALFTTLHILAGATPAAAAQSKPAASKPAAPKPAAAAKPAPEEWLALCGKCASPTVTSKTGIGTAKAVAEARMKRDQLTGPDGMCAANDNACIQTEMRKVYRASADCTAGRITAVDEKSYTLAGVWDGSDSGGGRTKWKDGDGQIVGRDNASGGLSISQQWELLCPAPVSAALVARASGQSAAPPAAGTAGQPSPCAGQRYCQELNTFAATITDFRTSLYGRNVRLVSATIRFHNKTARPLILGYVRTAAVAIDEQGNRYVIGSEGNVRGIGEAGGRSFDPKFTLAAGQASDARFEFSWEWDGRAIIGQRAWDVDLTIREINEVAAGQYRFGQEHVLSFKGVSPATQTTSAAGAMPVTASAAAPPASPTAAPPTAAPLPDACGGKSRCYDAGPFVAEVLNVTGSQARTARQWHIISMNIRFLNKTDQPIILGYVAGTGVMIDEHGNRYGPSAPPADAKGIGRVQPRSADPQFVLGPGQTRAATFGLQRAVYGNSMVIGSKYSYDMSLAQLEVLYNGQQVRTTREYSLSFPELGLGGSATAPDGSIDGITEAGKKLRDLFKKKPKG